MTGVQTCALPICRLAGIREVIGYATKKRGILLSKKIAPFAPDGQHRIDYYLHILEQAGLKVKDRHPEFFFGPEDLAQAEQFLAQQSVKKGDMLIGINAGGNWGLKRWPKENWAALADSLTDNLGAKVVITGSQKDIALAEGIRGLVNHGLIIAAGKLSLKAFAALCRRLDLFISADTGPLHIANAAGAKNIIALFGPTVPGITGPRPMQGVQIVQKDTGCKVPCYEVACPYNRCMRAITVEDVLARARAVKQILP